jgi:hypothetical protein
MLLSVRIPHLKRRGRKVATFLVIQGSSRHPLNEARNVIEAARNLQRAIDDVVNDIPPMRHVRKSEIPDLRYQSVGADGAKQSRSQGIG